MEIPDYILDPVFISIIVVTILFFGVLGLSFGFLFFRKKESTVKARVTKMREVADELKGELPGGGKEAENKSLLGNVDLRPTLGKFVGESYFTRLEYDLARADIPLRVSEFIIFRVIMVILVTGLGVILTRSVPIGICIGLPFLVIHIPVIALLKSLRIKRFTTQLAEFLTLIVNSLRAGQTFIQGCSVAVTESPNPIAAEFKQVIKEVNLGMPEAESMENLLKRVPSEDMRIVVSAYLIQRKVGGNLAEILETTALTIRERIKIQGKISALTTQGKLSGLLVGLLPFLLGVVLTLLNGEYMQPLIGTIPGYIAMGIGLVMQMIGVAIIWKIVNIEI
ncbi:MAG: type II secretion system F family protein [Verrucomicrobiota bacterium]